MKYFELFLVYARNYIWNLILFFFSQNTHIAHLIIFTGENRVYIIAAHFTWQRLLLDSFQKENKDWQAQKDKEKELLFIIWISNWDSCDSSFFRRRVESNNYISVVERNFTLSCSQLQLSQFSPSQSAQDDKKARLFSRETNYMLKC